MGSGKVLRYWCNVCGTERESIHYFNECSIADIAFCSEECRAAYGEIDLPVLFCCDGCKEESQTECRECGKEVFIE